MKRNLETLGLALVVVFATSAMLASGAQAVETFKSDSASGKTAITANNEAGTKPKFSLGGGVAVECASTNLEGTAPTNSQESLTMTAKTNGCLFGGAPSEVRWNHCAYGLKAATVETAGTGQKHGPVEIKCAVGSKVEIAAGGFCAFKIGPQTVKDGNVYTNVKEGGKEALTVHVTAKSIKIEEKEGPFCFLVGSEGELTGTVLAQGYEDTGSPTGAGTEATTPSTLKEGAQVNINKS